MISAKNEIRELLQLKNILLLGLVLILFACRGPTNNPTPPKTALHNTPIASTSNPIRTAISATPTPGQSTPESFFVTGPSATPTLDPTQVFQTNAAYDQTANAAADIRSTAIVHEIQVTVTPRTYQSFPSPNGKWLAKVILYDCAQIASPDADFTTSYEILQIAAWTVETQLLGCGGLGAAGLGGLFWTASSRFFYYTDAREGRPDGGFPWIRPLSRFDTITEKVEMLTTAVFAPGRQKIAGGQGKDLVIWDLYNDSASHFQGPDAGESWINWLSWSSDGRSLVYLAQVNRQGCSPCPSYLTRVDLESNSQTIILGEEDPPMLQVDWAQPDKLRLTGADFLSRYIYNLQSGILIPVPEATRTAEAKMTPTSPPSTQTPAPAYPPDPAFPADIYPPGKLFQYRLDQNDKEVFGHGCPSRLGLDAQEDPTVEKIQPVIEAIRTGDVFKLRANSDVVYWPDTGLSLRRQVSSLVSQNIAVNPATQSPLVNLLTRACGKEVTGASWWAQVNSENGVSDYFLVNRKERWLVWLSIYDFAQFRG